MDFKLSVIRMLIILMIFSFCGCNSPVEDLKNEKTEETIIIVKSYDKLMTVDKSENKSENMSITQVICIRDITNLYDDFAYKMKIAKWKQEIPSAPIRKKPPVEIDVKNYFKVLADLTNGLIKIEDIENPAIRLGIALENGDIPTLEDFSNNDELFFANEAVISAGAIYTKDQKYEQANVLYDKLINRCENEWNVNHDIETLKTMHGMYLEKGYTLRKMGAFEDRIPLFERLAKFSAKANYYRGVISANENIASTYGEMKGPYQKEKVIEVMKKVLATWLSIENPTKAQEYEAYEQIQSVHRIIEGAKTGGRFFIGRVD